MRDGWLSTVGVVLAMLLCSCARPGALKEGAQGARFRPHLSHAAFFPDPVESPLEVTRRCLECHPQAAGEVMATAHWQWLGEEIEIPGREGKSRIGKKNLINNFCLGIVGNWESCNRCHAGYGWEDTSFDFADSSRVDCLVCHDWSGQYLKGNSGWPRPGVDLAVSARSVGYPRRDNCGVCHHYGGGGLGVKHGDLDNSLDNPDENDDLHMGRAGMLCIDCHGGERHNIRGRSISVSVDRANSIGCTDCHRERPHGQERLDAHTDSVACQSCHIPEFARSVPTKMSWDWSQAGSSERPDDVHSYLKIKGEFSYDQGVVPEYRWFDGTARRYLTGDSIADEGPTPINLPGGSRDDSKSRIWPFKVHRGKQPADSRHRVLLQPVTAGKGGYWWEFDWDQAFRLGSELTGIPYSGEFEFVPTEMFWPLSHGVAPARRALGCTDCHGEGGRMDWSALGYDGDPAAVGGRSR